MTSKLLREQTFDPVLGADPGRGLEKKPSGDGDSWLGASRVGYAETA